MSASGGYSGDDFCCSLAHWLKELEKIFALDNFCRKRQPLFSPLKIWTEKIRTDSLR